MCGIAGFVQVGLDAAQARELATAMTDRIAHRGPDGAGCWSEGEVALGHRRLSIVDLSPTGAQPMTSASGRYVIVFNGEIYNHAEMRLQLARAGVRFRGTSDTEVLLALVEARGVRGAIEASVGMFAFAVWDREMRVLTLTRDRMGEKPLYYGWAGDTFLFGSELKALRAHPHFANPVDGGSVALLLRWAYIPAPWSIYMGIRKLRAGELLEFEVNHGPAPLRARCRETLHRYWRIEDLVAEGLASPFVGTLSEAADALKLHLSTAVRLQLRADVPLGAFLSGGIDSSLVVALMKEHAAHTVRTFSIGFDEPGFDESAEARSVANHLGTEHTELRVTPAEARAVIPSLPQMFDEPLADASQIPTYLVSSLARRQVKVSLSGDGGDELFGGYAKYAAGARLAAVPCRTTVSWSLRSAPIRAIASVLASMPGARNAFAKRRIGRLSQMLAADEPALARMLSDNCPELAALARQTPPPVPAEAVSATRPAPYGTIASLIDLCGYLPDDVLTKVDRASMSVSLESRAPMLDHRVVEFACRLPWFLRGGDGNLKRVMRQLLYRHVPQALVDRPKMGFSVPIAAWLRNELLPWAEDLFESETLRTNPFIDASVLHRYWLEHKEGRADRSPLLWSALTYLAWSNASA